ncbi:MAG: CHAP domain-containing protein [Patescibacteria group bacterium]
MVLHDRTEPPSSAKTIEANKKEYLLTHIKLGIAKVCRRDAKKFFFAGFDTILTYIKSTSLSGLFDLKFLPHFALVFLLLIVLVANFGDSAQARALSLGFININPDEEQSIVENVDRFTTIPGILDDKTAVAKGNSAMADKEGFLAIAAPVDTQITERTTPLPDNSSETVYYIVESGDTLTGLGWKFDVKLSTLKYLNDIDNINSIKPGVKLKIPPRGYEVSATEIAKKENAKKSKLAAANRTTVARSTASIRSATQSYVGTINGVRYVRKAKANEMQCYTYVTSQGYPVGGHWLAKWIPTNSRTPKAGGLVVTNESWAGHVAVVTSVNSDGSFNIRESNYTHGWITERTMSRNYYKIIGFVN